VVKTVMFLNDALGDRSFAMCCECMPYKVRHKSASQIV